MRPTASRSCGASRNWAWIPGGAVLTAIKPIEAIRALPLDAGQPAAGPRRRPDRACAALAGKLYFLEIRDWSGHMVRRPLKGKEHAGQEVDAWSSYIQVMIGQKQVGEQGWALAQELDLGDLIGVDGTLGKTRTGELTIFAEKLHFLGKSLLPHPDKWGGMQEIEYRLRHRYLDLLYNPETLERTLNADQDRPHDPQPPRRAGFLEVETPTLHAIAGGAAARPFITHHNALDIDLYLRIALELHLEAAAGRRHREGLRDRPGVSQRGHQSPSTIPNSPCWSCTRPTATITP